jgi:hypothetical protein
MTTTEYEFPSLVTPTAGAGLDLAEQLADRLRTELQPTAKDGDDHPGGTSYLVPAPVPREIIASILFYAIAAANHGWRRRG